MTTKRFVGCAFCFTAIVVTGLGCNVDGRYAGRQRPKGAINGDATRLAGDSKGVNIDIADTQEVDLVERVVSHRDAYRRSLEALHDYYAARGNAVKQQWAAWEIAGLRKVKFSQYMTDAEIPASNLKPTTSIAEADQRFEEGKKTMRAGGYGLPGIYRQDRMIEAAAQFRDLIRAYPASDKIDDAAFLLGEIHKDYLSDQETIAVQWYERVWEWDPDTTYPAKFNAATLYDYRLQERDRALVLYHDVIRESRIREGDMNQAAKRIHELTRGERSAGTGTGTLPKP